MLTAALQCIENILESVVDIVNCQAFSLAKVEQNDNLQAVAVGIGDRCGSRSLQCLSQDALTPPGAVSFIGR